ncbi:hypothetical protein MKK88_09585 [Methylobacterium sp. E-005]|uniref:hypothetical protein n=1 Tax=Methylobacterium sp. E-005 TaxID=2836549 RepID=UPI001FB8C2A8|nr:hypothetical protein [Methylobacterium sp. E-005]MCJ2086245.1 hypothetical protein [Methylobacterium sp. E-005]
MMPSPDLERFATLIADNVVTAYERDREGAPFHPTMRTTVVSVLVRSLLLVLPTTSSGALAAACNRGLDDVVGAIGIGGPRVDHVDPDDGSVTMTAV